MEGGRRKRSRVCYSSKALKQQEAEARAEIEAEALRRAVAHDDEIMEIVLGAVRELEADEKHMAQLSFPSEQIRGAMKRRLNARVEANTRPGSKNKYARLAKACGASGALARVLQKLVDAGELHKIAPRASAAKASSAPTGAAGSGSATVLEPESILGWQFSTSASGSTAALAGLRRNDITWQFFPPEAALNEARHAAKQKAEDESKAKAQTEAKLKAEAQAQTGGNSEAVDRAHNAAAAATESLVSAKSASEVSEQTAPSSSPPPPVVQPLSKRRERRRTRSRVIEVDGHRVLRANNYSLEEGEQSVHDRELRGGLSGAGANDSTGDQRVFYGTVRKPRMADTVLETLARLTAPKAPLSQPPQQLSKSNDGPTTHNAERWQQCEALLARICSHEFAEPFLTPVEASAVPGYSDVVTQPMDLGTVRNRLENGEYATMVPLATADSDVDPDLSGFHRFAADVNLVWSNCKAFNESDSEIWAWAEQLSRDFELEFEKHVLQHNSSVANTGGTAESDHVPVVWGEDAAIDSCDHALGVNLPVLAEAVRMRCLQDPQLAQLEFSMGYMRSAVANGMRKGTIRRRLAVREVHANVDLPTTPAGEGADDATVVSRFNTGTEAALRLFILRALGPGASALPTGIAGDDSDEEGSAEMSVVAEAPLAPLLAPPPSTAGTSSNPNFAAVQGQAAAVPHADESSESAGILPEAAKVLEPGVWHASGHPLCGADARHWVPQCGLAQGSIAAFMVSAQGDDTQSEERRFRMRFCTIEDEKPGVETPAGLAPAGTKDIILSEQDAKDAVRLASAYETSGASNSSRGVTGGEAATKQSQATASVQMGAARSALEATMAHQYAGPFLEPVDPDALGIPTYFDIIKRPMDLGTVHAQLIGGGVFSTPEQMAQQVRLTFDNAMRFNDPSSLIHTWAASLKRHFAKQLVSDIAKAEAAEQAKAKAKAKAKAAAAGSDDEDGTRKVSLASACSLPAIKARLKVEHDCKHFARPFSAWHGLHREGEMQCGGNWTMEPRRGRYDYVGPSGDVHRTRAEAEEAIETAAAVAGSPWLGQIVRRGTEYNAETYTPPPDACEVWRRPWEFEWQIRRQAFNNALNWVLQGAMRSGHVIGLAPDPRDGTLRMIPPRCDSDAAADADDIEAGRSAMSCPNPTCFMANDLFFVGEEKAPDADVDADGQPSRGRKLSGLDLVRMHHNRGLKSDAAAMLRHQRVFLRRHRATLSPFLGPADAAALEAEVAAGEPVELPEFDQSMFVHGQPWWITQPSQKQDSGQGSNRSGGGSGEPELVLKNSGDKADSGTLRPYQMTGLNWLARCYERGICAILADEMGLGKTLQTISFIGYLQYHRHARGPHLVVVPLSVLTAWVMEFRRWCPRLRVVRLHSADAVERERLKKEVLVDIELFDIVVTTYEMVVSPNMRYTLCSKLRWRLVVLDEGHRIKNEKTGVSDAVRQLRCQMKLLLTGTPLQNNLHELYALLNYMFPTVFVSPEAFDECFDLARGTVDRSMLHKARDLLRPFILRRVKTDVELNLPPKFEIKIGVPLSPAQLFWYKHLLLRDSSALMDNAAAQTEGSNVAAANAADGNSAESKKLQSLLTQLRKCCNHPYLFDGADPNPEQTTSDIIESSAKMLLLDRLLAKLKVGGHRVLLFSQFTSMLDILEDYCKWRNYCCCRLDGSSNRVQRSIDVRRFNQPKSKHFIFLLSTRAGGLGLNLASADTVILYDSDWNPQVDLQAMDRAHRIGQTKPVHVYRLITEDTVEERIFQRAQKKLFLDKMVNTKNQVQNANSGVQAGKQRQVESEASDDLNEGELMATLRFGVDSIFAASGSMPTDDELDAIIARASEKPTGTAAKSSSSSSSSVSVSASASASLSASEASSSSSAAPASSVALVAPTPAAPGAPDAPPATAVGQNTDAAASRLHTSKVTVGEFDAEAKATDLRKFAGTEYTKQKKPSSLKDIGQQYREFASQLPSRRKRESRFIEVDGHTVLKLNNYSLEEGESSVYKSEVQRGVAPMDQPGANANAPKSVRATSKRMGAQGRQQAGKDYMHESICLSCWDGGTLVCCDMCPASYHPGKRGRRFTLHFSSMM